MGLSMWNNQDNNTFLFIFVIFAAELGPIFEELLIPLTSPPNYNYSPTWLFDYLRCWWIGLMGTNLAKSDCLILNLLCTCSFHRHACMWSSSVHPHQIYVAISHSKLAFRNISAVVLSRYIPSKWFWHQQTSVHGLDELILHSIWDRQLEISRNPLEESWKCFGPAGCPQLHSVPRKIKESKTSRQKNHNSLFLFILNFYLV